MTNPSNSYQNSGSYLDLLKRITQKVQQKKVDDKMLVIMQQVFENELDKENIVLAQPERVRLFRQVTKAVLTDMFRKLDDIKYQKI
jgi:hypothetical protein